MSEDQKVSARQKIASKQADLEYVAKKLQALQQQNAQRVLQELAARGIFIRMPGVSPMNRCIRISCGQSADLDALATAFGPALAAARAAG